MTLQRLEKDLSFFLFKIKIYNEVYIERDVICLFFIHIRVRNISKGSGHIPIQGSRSSVSSPLGTDDGIPLSYPDLGSMDIYIGFDMTAFIFLAFGNRFSILPLNPEETDFTHFACEIEN